MRITAATEPGTAGTDNDDRHVVDAAREVVVVADGVTARTDTGCTHPTSWFAQTLADEFAARAAGLTSLRGALVDAIEATAAAHPDCDPTHPGAPAATIAAVARYSSDAIEILVLGDATVIVATGEETRAHTQSVDHIAAAERDAACALPIGDPDRDSLLVAMKQTMNAHRNTDRGYWVAAAESRAAYRSYSRIVPRAGLRHVLVLSDGAAALADLYGATDHPGLVALAAREGAAAIIKRVRAMEDADPEARRYRRTKRSDDATAILIDYTAEASGDGSV